MEIDYVQISDVIQRRTAYGHIDKHQADYLAKCIVQNLQITADKSPYNPKDKQKLEKIIRESEVPKDANYGDVYLVDKSKLAQSIIDAGFKKEIKGNKMNPLGIMAMPLLWFFFGFGVILFFTVVLIVEGALWINGAYDG